MSLKKQAFSGLCALFLLAQAQAYAQDLAPTPRKMPRTPVARETLADSGKKVVIPTTRTLTGSAAIIDSERLKIGDIEMRLFGIVTPHLSAPYGPQTRAMLDNLTSAGATNCVIHDRDREGRFFATCRNAAGADLGLELLRRGLAAAARGSLRASELSTAYIAAEQAAQSGRLGLWSVTPPAAVSDAAMKEVAARNQAAAAAAAQAARDEAAAVAARNEAILARNEAAALAAAAAATSNAAAANVPEVAPAPPPDPEPIPATVQTPSAPVSRLPAPEPRAQNPASVTPYIVPVENIGMSPQTINDMGFVEKYQLLVTGLLMLLTTMGVVVAVMGQRWWDKREELRSIAAALRGELMAARAVCQARLGTMSTDDERNMGWPRIRTLVFQAYVGRLGYLGAILARQIASIYGQASDYASYYNTKSGDSGFEPVSRKQALQTLVNHIEEVLPPLARIELGKMRVKSAKMVTLPARTEEIPALPAGAKIKVLADQGTADEKADKTDKADKKEPPVVAIAASVKPVRLWDSIRRFVTHRHESAPAKPPASTESLLDYVVLSEEEEQEAMAYGGSLDEEAKTLEKEKKKKAKNKRA